MASYNSILRHVSMADGKRNTWKLQEQKRVDEQRRQEELDLLRYNNSPLYSDWRFDLSENMTTQAMTYATTLPGEGDTNLETAINSTGINANGVESGENATVTTRGFDVTKYTTIKFDVTQLTSGTQALRLFANYGPDPNQFYILRNDLNANPIVSIESYYANRDNFKLQVRSFNEDPGNMATYRVSASFQRRTPITVFVAIDNPEASAFVRTGGFSEYSNEEKKKRLEQMMRASDEYLFSVYGDLFPGTGAVGFDDVQDVTSWEQAIERDNPNQIKWPRDYRKPGEGTPGQYYDKHMKQWVPVVKKASAGGGDEIAQEPGLMRKGLEKQTGGKTAPMPMKKQPTGGNMPIVPSDYNPNDETVLAQGDPRGPMPDYVRDSIRRQYKGGPDYKREDMKNVINWNKKKAEANPNKKKNSKKKQPVVAHYEPDGEVIIEKKLKKPQAFFKDKDIKPEFPENPPPPQIKGLHPDLVTGDSVSQRFNKLDPISARAMPRTGIKSVDKKVQIASKKPK